MIYDAIQRPVNVGDHVAYVRKPGSAESVRYEAKVVNIVDDPTRSCGTCPECGGPPKKQFGTIEIVFIASPWEPDNFDASNQKRLKVSSLSVVVVPEHG